MFTPRLEGQAPVPFPLASLDEGSVTWENPTHDFPASGTYQVTLTVTDQGGNTDSVTKSVLVPEGVGSPVARSTAWRPSSAGTTRTRG